MCSPSRRPAGAETHALRGVIALLAGPPLMSNPQASDVGVRRDRRGDVRAVRGWRRRRRASRGRAARRDGVRPRPARRCRRRARGATTRSGGTARRGSAPRPSRFSIGSPGSTPRRCAVPGISLREAHRSLVRERRGVPPGLLQHEAEEQVLGDAVAPRGEAGGLLELRAPAAVAGDRRRLRRLGPGRPQPLGMAVLRREPLVDERRPAREGAVLRPRRSGRERHDPRGQRRHRPSCHRSPRRWRPR